MQFVVHAKAPASTNNLNGGGADLKPFWLERLNGPGR